jgi:hypothetical protein
MPHPMAPYPLTPYSKLEMARIGKAIDAGASIEETLEESLQRTDMLFQHVTAIASMTPWSLQLLGRRRPQRVVVVALAGIAPYDQLPDFIETCVTFRADQCLFVGHHLGGVKKTTTYVTDPETGARKGTTVFERLPADFPVDTPEVLEGDVVVEYIATSQDYHSAANIQLELRVAGLSSEILVKESTSAEFHTGTQAETFVSAVRANGWDDGNTVVLIMAAPGHLYWRAFPTFVKALQKAGLFVPMIPLGHQMNPVSPQLTRFNWDTEGDTEFSQIEFCLTEQSKVLAYVADVARLPELGEFISQTWEFMQGVPNKGRSIDFNGSGPHHGIDWNM